MRLVLVDTAGTGVLKDAICGETRVLRIRLATRQKRQDLL